MAAGGMTNKEIAAKLGTDQNKVGRWRRRFADEGLDGMAKERRGVATTAARTRWPKRR